MLKLIHTADIHLGSKLKFLGERAAKQRENIVSAFEASIKQALDKEVDLFLIAGDLFDSNNPANSTVLLAVSEIKKLLDANIYVALIAGNHDIYDAGTVYKRADFEILTDNPYFHLFTADSISNWNISDLNAVIYAANVTKKKRAVTQLTDFERVEAKYQVAMFHGSVDILTDPSNYPLPLQTIKKLELDYVALGDWHGLLKVNERNPCCYYSGSPEVIASDQSGAGSVLFVEIDNKQVKVQPVKVGQTKIEKLEVDVTALNSALEVVDVVKHQIESIKTTILNLTLIGELTLTSDIDLESVRDFLNNLYFYVNIIDKTRFALSDSEIKEHAKHFVFANYIEFIKQYKKDNPDKQEVADLALREGLNLLISKKNLNEAD